MAEAHDIVKSHIRPGVRLAGRYEIEGYVGAGAYGVIFSAIDVETMERVAVKAIPPASHGVNTTAVGRFKREFKVISKLRHPNIIALYDFGETEAGIIYMILEFVDGDTLYDVAKERALDEAVALSVTRQMAAALAEAHGKGVIHRDLKPQNVMLARKPGGGYQVKVLDFGMAKLLSGGADESLLQLTREGVAVGTPRYIAPEQARGRPVGPSADLYALGLLFYEALTGQRAVKADTVESAILAHVSPEPLQLDEIEDVPAYMRPVLMKLIEKDKDRRYQDARDVLRDLDSLDETRMMDEAASTFPIGEDAAHFELETGASEDAFQGTQRQAPQQAQHEHRSLRSTDDLALDYDRYHQFASDEPADPPQPRRRPSAEESSFAFRTPHHIFEWLELLTAFFLAPIAFVLLTAHFEGTDYFLRFFLGSLATVVPLVGALIIRSRDWGWSFFRLWVVASVIAIVLAHVIGLDELAIGLLRNPAWFLAPVQDVPVLGGIYDFVASSSRTYASLIGNRSLTL